MKNKLKQITDLTIQEVLGNEIILPSTYFKIFDKNIKKIDKNLKNENVSIDNTNIILEEFNSINKYMDKTLDNINKTSQINNKAIEAIKNNDLNILNKITEEMKELENELLLLKDSIYTDSFTNTYNRKYLFKEILNSRQKTINEGIFLFLEIPDYEYLIQEHNNIIADNLLIFIIKFVKDKLEEEQIEYTCIRYYQNTFIITIQNSKMLLLDNIISNINSSIKNSTLKSKSGIILQPKFKYSLEEYKKNENFLSIFENLNNKL